jgi:uncharacterized protein
MDFVFEWDEHKAQSNLRKHKISFQEAVTVFHDPLVATIPDPDHSSDEERLVAIGYSNKHRLLVVVFTERGQRTRIISYRRAEPAEREIYEEA